MKLWLKKNIAEKFVATIQSSDSSQYSLVLIPNRKCVVGGSRIRLGDSGTPSTIIYTRWNSRHEGLGCHAPMGLILWSLPLAIWSVSLPRAYLYQFAKQINVMVCTRWLSYYLLYPYCSCNMPETCENWLGLVKFTRYCLTQWTALLSGFQSSRGQY